MQPIRRSGVYADKVNSNNNNEGKVVANDTEGRERLARYIIRPPVSLKRLTYDRQGQQVFYQGKDQTSTYDPIDFLAYASLHIPDKGEQLLRYYGWYSNKSRGLSPLIRNNVNQHGQD